jgi:hypothetical protein
LLKNNEEMKNRTAQIAPVQFFVASGPFFVTPDTAISRYFAATFIFREIVTSALKSYSYDRNELESAGTETGLGITVTRRRARLLSLSGDDHVRVHIIGTMHISSRIPAHEWQPCQSWILIDGRKI